MLGISELYTAVTHNNYNCEICLLVFANVYSFVYVRLQSLALVNISNRLLLFVYVRLRSFTGSS
jgi:hypothetical protein